MSVTIRPYVNGGWEADIQVLDLATTQRYMHLSPAVVWRRPSACSTTRRRSQQSWRRADLAVGEIVEAQGTEGPEGPKTLRKVGGGTGSCAESGVRGTPVDALNEWRRRPAEAKRRLMEAPGVEFDYGRSPN
jgi:hypothetical protein